MQQSDVKHIGEIKLHEMGKTFRCNGKHKLPSKNWAKDYSNFQNRCEYLLYKISIEKKKKKKKGTNRFRPLW